MVEPLLYAALGFLTASLVALFFGRALWNRAVRLTTHRIMRRLPLSRDEIVASRDLLRAEQAVEYRRLERQANLMRERMGSSMAAVGERETRIAHLNASIEQSRAEIATVEAREAAARAEIAKLEAEQSLIRGKLADTERHLTEAQRDLQQSQSDRRELLQLADARRAELSESTARIAEARQATSALEKRLAFASAQAADAQSRLDAALNARETEAERAERTHAKLIATESRLAQALTQLETAGRDGPDTARPIKSGGEDLILLRQQIEKLARDIVRAAGPAGHAQPPELTAAPVPAVVAAQPAPKTQRNRKSSAATASTRRD